MSEQVKRRKKIGKRNGWELNHGLFEVLWKDNVAVAVKVEGSLFHAAHRIFKLKPERAAAEAEPEGR